MIDITFIIVSWNAKDYLDKCLKSILSVMQEMNYEILVIDNASEDGSIELVESNYPSVILIKNNENLGFAKANNIGINKAKGRYLALINSDVVILPKCLQQLTEFMNKNTDIGLSAPKILNGDRSLQVSCRNFPNVWNNFCQAFFLNRLFPNTIFFADWFMDYWDHNEIRDIDVLSGCFWFARKEAVQKVGGLDENFFFYGEDIDWCKRFHLDGWKVKLFPLSQAIHFGGASSACKPIKYIIEMQKANLLYWKKYDGFLGVISYRLLTLIRYSLRLPPSLLLSFNKQYRLKAIKHINCILWSLYLR